MNETIDGLNMDGISYEQLLLLFDKLNIGAFTTDNNQRITSLNRSLQSLLGRKKEELVDKRCRDIFQNSPCESICPLEGVLKPEQEAVEFEVVDADGGIQPVTRLLSPMYGPDNEISGCLSILQDKPPIADLINRVNYDLRSMNIIIDNLDIGILTVNRGGYVTFFNSAAEKISGFDRSLVIGEPVSMLFSNDRKRDLGMLLEVMKSGRSRKNMKLSISSPEGESIPIRTDYIPLKNEFGKPFGGLATIHDLTLLEQLDQVISEKYRFHNMVGKHSSMQAVFETVSVAAASNATVLIEGATGTGKDLLAKIIHSASPRHKENMVKVNCAALPDNLLESEMFGYVKGAFTGADRDKPGRFQIAEGGTIFLDEIGDMPLFLQAKLLRVLDDKEFYPLGGRETVKVDVRILSATNRNLAELVAKGLFREDLFYRLNVLRIELPSLRERKSDLPMLIRHIIRKLCSAREGRNVDVSDEALAVLMNYDFPGNVRELENILEHALIVCRGDAIYPKHMQGCLQKCNAEGRISEKFSMKPDGESTPIDREKVIQMLQQNGWRRQDTARALGIDRTTLWRKMKKYGLMT